MVTKTAGKGETRIVDGNRAASLAVQRCRPEVVAIFPITPQTPMIEDICKYVADGTLDAELVEAEGENSVIGVLTGASACGARTFTATSSYGLAFMFDGYWFAAGSRLPIVMIDCTREMAAPGGVSSGHGDANAVKDAGWIHIHVETCQEIHDAVIQAYRLAEDSDVLIPTMVVMDGFYLSHLTERIELARQEDVDEFLAPLKKMQRTIVTLEKPMIFSMQSMGKELVEYRHKQLTAMQAAKEKIDQVDRDFAEFFGRSWGGQIEEYRCDDAEIVLMTMGSMTGTARVVVDAEREAGLKVGLIKVRAFRPFPRERILQAVRGKKAIGVIDRSVVQGWNAGHLWVEMKAVLSDLPAPIPMPNFLDGLGGLDISKQNVKRAVAIAEQASRGLPYPEVTWMGLE